jgi:hypothetical protein
MSKNSLSIDKSQSGESTCRLNPQYYLGAEKGGNFANELVDFIGEFLSSSDYKNLLGEKKMLFDGIWDDIVVKLIINIEFNRKAIVQYYDWEAEETK